jgi:hypothetical protein
LPALREVLGALGTVVPVVDRADGARADTLVDSEGVLKEHYGMTDAAQSSFGPTAISAVDTTSGDPNALAAHLSEVLHVRHRSSTAAGGTAYND